MKNLGKLKLNQLSKVELDKREMKNLRGGTCGCGCPSGDTAQDNANANMESDCEDECSDFYYLGSCWVRASDGATLSAG